jgi:hypothetical protein
MKKLTGKEILERLEEYFNPNSYDNNVIDFIHKWYNEDLLGLGEIVEVQRKVCTESDKVSIVNYFVDHNVYIKTKGTASRTTLFFNKGFGKEVKKIEKTFITYK